MAELKPFIDRSGAEIRFRCEPDLSPVEFIDVLRRSGLAERRPVDQPERISRMLAQADLIVTARDGDNLIGVARSVTDFSYCCYLSDLAVDRQWQGRGIGRVLMTRTRTAAGGDAVRCILLSAPAAIEFYEKVGLERHPNCFDFTNLPD
ncbi:GNAT family N-acetyltransferase [Skermanella mucosa]|uniref:GNAT family N-acetyltransferase n=1 Tax=Skermanella mucosa TaxID=1789672 RepID=UPI001E2FBD7B|nr:GNAT family N-acetyltransferase [Skermanella mucosa]UEM23204.1 GNAT family N-acetyltransferase [Skermanella mucosa]